MRNWRCDKVGLQRPKQSLDMKSCWCRVTRWCAHQRMFGNLCVILLLNIGGTPAHADASSKVPQRETVPLQKSKESRELVHRLMSPDFLERLRAEEECLRSGPGILPTLREVMSSDEAELRWRAQNLIEQIENEELSVAIEQFLDSQLESTLPGWILVADAIGDTPENRAAFADSLRGNPELARALNHPETIGVELQRQLQRIGSQGSIPAGISSSRSIGILLLLVHPRANYSSEWGEVALRSIRNGIIQGANETPEGQLLQALVSQAVAIPRAGLPQDRMELALRLSLPEVVTPAIELIAQRNNPHQLNFAFVSIARYGGTAEMSIVEGLLEDTFELSAGHGPDDNKTSSTQIRDLALATLIVMTDQDPKEYGLRDFPKDHSKNVTSLIVAFESDSQREVAMEKWRTWSRSHLRKYRPLPANAEEGVSL